MWHLKTSGFQRPVGAMLASIAVLCSFPVHAQASKTRAVVATPAPGPDLDLSVHYTSRILTAEGVLRESRYEEKMMRRGDHVWTERVLPKDPSGHEASHGHGKQAAAKPSGKDEHGHRHFNHVMLPKHVFLTNGELRLEFVDFHQREVISIAPSEYENVNFDGSWANAFFLADPKIVSTIPVTHRASPVAGAQWRELAKGDMVQRVLWDGKRQIPLLVEKVDSRGRYVQRMEVKVQPGLAKSLPWERVKGYAQKEYADFLD